MAVGVNVVKHDTYEAAKLNALLQIIQSAHNSGQKQDYEVLLDDFKVVPRTSDPEAFNNFSEFINEDTKIVQVFMYRGGSNQKDKYYFHIKGRQKEQNLSGIPENTTQEEWEKKQKEKLLREIRFETLEKENAELKEQLEEKEKTNEQLEERLQQMRDGKLLGIGEMGSAIVMKVLGHPTMQKNFPGLQGFSEMVNNETNTQTKQQESASFQRKGENKEESKEEKEQYAETISEEERGYMILIRDLQSRLSPFQLSSVMHILDLLTQCPVAIGSTQKHLNNFLNAQTQNKNPE